MNTRTRTKLGMLAAIALLGIAAPVLAEPHKDDHHAGKGDDHHEGKADEHHEGKPDEHGNGRDHHPAASASAMAGEAPSAAPPGSAGPGLDSKLAERLHKFIEKRQRERRAALKDPKSWDDGRPGRALEHRSEIASTWGNAVAVPEAQAELKKHAERMAKLNRILDLANEKGDTALATRVQAVIQTEVDRDAQFMQTIQAKAGAK
jgi:hypothetical protein